MFKVRYLQLHVGDDQGYSFPSKAFPKLGMKNGSCCGGIPPKVWTFKEMHDLEAYATARGVTIVPELETPGHHEGEEASGFERPTSFAIAPDGRIFVAEKADFDEITDGLEQLPHSMRPVPA